MQKVEVSAITKNFLAKSNHTKVTANAPEEAYNNLATSSSQQAGCKHIVSYTKQVLCEVCIIERLQEATTFSANSVYSAVYMTLTISVTTPVRS